MTMHGGEEEETLVCTGELRTTLRELAPRIVELLLEWDENNDGSTDAAEFRRGLPVFELRVPASEVDKLFDSILSASGSEDGAVEHWTLFRLLRGGGETSPEDVIKEQDALQTKLEAKRELHATGESAFWTRDKVSDDGRSVATNRHSLRKRTGAIRRRCGRGHRHSHGT